MSKPPVQSYNYWTADDEAAHAGNPSSADFAWVERTRPGMIEQLTIF